VIAIGIMSGTSVDGVDAVTLELTAPDVAHPDRRGDGRVIDHVFVPFPADLRAKLIDPSALRVWDISALHFELPSHYERAARALRGFSEATVCGCHGQTLWHAPPSSGASPAHTLQIGSASALATRLGIPVVGDLRAADIARGGEGAPIAPIAHWFFSPVDLLPSLVVNLGGIANMTYVTERLEDVVSYDVGPAMMLSDAWAAESTGGRETCDLDGLASEHGTVIEPLVAEVLAHPFLGRPPPKSTGREDFGRDFFAPIFARYARNEPASVARSLLEATARGLWHAVEGDPRIVGLERVTLTGGGAKNPTLVAIVQRLFGATPVTVDDTGPLAPSHHEPVAMALIAARTIAGLPSSIANVTGAAAASVLGCVARP
jgi:anhydro-N-acetylmuramic acid kinase